MSNYEKLRDAFHLFDQTNPQVYRLVNRFAAEAMRAGHERFAIAAIWERIRWEVQVVTGDINFKLPNNHRAFYARKWLNDNPGSSLFRVAYQRSHGEREHDEFGRDMVWDVDQDWPS